MHLRSNTAIFTYNYLVLLFSWISSLNSPPSNLIGIEFGLTINVELLFQVTKPLSKFFINWINVLFSWVPALIGEVSCFSKSFPIGIHEEFQKNSVVIFFLLIGKLHAKVFVNRQGVIRFFLKIHQEKSRWSRNSSIVWSIWSIL